MNHDPMPLLLPLATPHATLSVAGGKGMSLAKMLAAGLPVPGGFLVTTQSYRLFVDANGLQAQIAAALDGLDALDPPALEAASQRIAAAFAAGAMPPLVAELVKSAYANLGPDSGRGGGRVPVAVRSSATAEDLPDASFAGQQDSYLNITGAEAVLDAVRRCWASLWTARAIAYRLRGGIDQETVALAVVVQELVFADAAGILFTANPLNGSRGEMLINAAWGLGEAVVGGDVTPDTITADKASGKVLRRETARKLVMTVRTADGSDEVPVPAERQNAPVLSDAQVAELARLGRTIEQMYAMPMDVEWALAGEAFAVVQARPITALPPDWQRPDPQALYARSSLAEHTPSPVTPLFATLGLHLANEATMRMWERMLGSHADAVKPEGDMYQVLNGYIFLAARMTGADLNTLRVAAMSLRQVWPMMRGSVLRWQAARREFAAVVDHWEARPLDQMDERQLLEAVRTVFLAACRYFTEIQTVLPVTGASEVLFTRLYDALVRREGDPPAATFLLGLDTTALAAEKSLHDLARWVEGDRALAAYAAGAAGEQMAAGLQADGPPAASAVTPAVWAEWRGRFGRHLDAYGRTAYEFDFASPTPYDAPGPLLDSIKAFLAGGVGSPYARQAAAAERREGATQAVLQRLDPLRRDIFLRLLRWAQETGPMREDSIAAMGLGHPLLRRLLGELGRRFAAAGAILSPDEIYWLQESEVEGLIAALSSGSDLPDLSAAISPRKEQWRAAFKISPPILLPERSFWSRFVEGGDAQQQDGKTVLKGAGTSGGRVTAPARTLFGPEDFGAFQAGDVLVAVTTTPAWTPLFTLASAVVTDIGGPLSHSSIVAREYGIPAVMATRSATRTIRSGQLVTVDGTAGTVTLEDG